MFLWRRVAPQSPEEGLKPTAAPGYARNFRALNRLIAQGKSFSGYERNILLLNLNGQRFADVGGALGVDFDDDSRAVATADWDGDGSLDLWVTNRTGPRIRLLRNRAAAGRTFLSVRLAGNGTTTNRDAVGARLTLWPEADPQARQIRTVRAGDGFLSQSSGQCHFGLGSATGPCTLTIAWPGGEVQILTGLLPNQNYTIQQNEQALAKNQPPANLSEIPAGPEEPEDTRATGFWVANRVPFPSLTYLDERGASRSTSDLRGRPILVTLWATWCAPCLKELADFTRHQKLLQAAGATVLALNVDDLAADTESHASTPPAEVLQRLGFPFPRGIVRPEGLAKLEIMIEFLSARRLPLAVPASFLLDAEGAIAAVYLEPVPFDRLAADLSLLKAPVVDQLRRLSPRPGLWSSDPREIDRAAYLGDYATLFVTNGFLDESQRLYQLIKPRDGDRTAQDFYNQAKTAAQQRQTEEAMRLYGEALRLQPDYGEALTGLGALLLMQNRHEEARPHFEKALALDPNHATALVNMAMIDQRRGDTTSALARLRSVTTRNPDFAEAHLNLGSLLASLKQHQDAIRHLSKAVELNPRLIPAHLNLAAAFMETGQWELAVKEYQAAASLNPRLPFPLAGLGSCFARQNRHTEAVESFRKALALGGATPQIHTQLGRSLLALGQTAAARDAFQAALKLDPQNAAASQALKESSQIHQP